MTKIAVIGHDEAALEGLVQTLAAAGHDLTIAFSLADAREAAARHTPLVAVVDRAIAVTSAAQLLGLPLAPGGALVLYRPAGAAPAPISAILQRSVLADLTLPLERNRLLALIQSVTQRARVTGRRERGTPPETRAV